MTMFYSHESYASTEHLKYGVSISHRVTAPSDQRRRAPSTAHAAAISYKHVGHRTGASSGGGIIIETAMRA
ncbi:hypothetical protein [Burkholderia metallica]|uniref:Uncharacterized protein n=1 Tax=Burkholderia metallica TaxID=488729 RepID=A0ABT8PF50_9BURK|nr:hypothetical protein [Burkholderia metallica]MDN7933093.1 hypothetical protein [Burkholderia metallica]